MNEQWQFLANSYWFVPTMYLPAFQMSAADTAPVPMTDQTVWQITTYQNGYFWGNCAVLLYPNGTVPEEAPSARRLLGTITPDGNVQITFMPLNKLGAAMSTAGWGRMQQQNGVWTFEMQMSSGVSSLVAHWAYMYPTQEGEPSWNQLPGTDYDVPGFLEAAGF
jgi:hypothetical protein